MYGRDNLSRHAALADNWQENLSPQLLLTNRAMLVKVACQNDLVSNSTQQLMRRIRWLWSFVGDEYCPLTGRQKSDARCAAIDW